MHHTVFGILYSYLDKNIKLLINDDIRVEGKLLSINSGEKWIKVKSESLEYGVGSYVRYIDIDKITWIEDKE